jgi:hypothetical protein
MGDAQQMPARGQPPPALFVSVCEVKPYTDRMSEEPPPPNPYSNPTSGSHLLLRAILVGAVILAGIVGIIWYTSK